MNRLRDFSVFGFETKSRYAGFSCFEITNGPLFILFIVVTTFTQGYPKLPTISEWHVSVCVCVCVCITNWTH